MNANLTKKSPTNPEVTPSSYRATVISFDLPLVIDSLLSYVDASEIKEAFDPILAKWKRNFVEVSEETIKTHVFPNGKYAGQTIKAILDADEQYVLWYANEVSGAKSITARLIIWHMWATGIAPIRKKKPSSYSSYSSKYSDRGDDRTSSHYRSGSSRYNGRRDRRSRSRSPRRK